MVNAQEWLNEKFPTRESRAAVEQLSIDSSNDRIDEIREKSFTFKASLEGELDLSDFVNLASFAFWYQPQSVRIKGLGNCPRLFDFYVVGSQPRIITSLETQLIQESQQAQQEKQQLKNNWVLAVTNLDKAREQLNESQARIQELETEVNTHFQALQTIQDQAEQKQQRILALEADKQDLIHQLSQSQQKHHQQTEQEKQQLTQEITLIKEVLND